MVLFVRPVQKVAQNVHQKRNVPLVLLDSLFHCQHVLETVHQNTIKMVICANLVQMTVNHVNLMILVTNVKQDLIYTRELVTKYAQLELSLTTLFVLIVIQNAASVSPRMSAQDVNLHSIIIKELVFKPALLTLMLNPVFVMIVQRIANHVIMEWNVLYAKMDLNYIKEFAKRSVLYLTMQ